MTEPLDIHSILYAAWGLKDARVIETQRLSDTDVRYRIQAPYGAFYLKTQSGTRYQDLELLTALYSHLFTRIRKEALPVKTADGGFFYRQGSRLLFLTRLLEFRSFSFGIEDFTALGRSLGEFHRALEDFPLAPQVRKNAFAFRQRQAETRDQVLSAVRDGCLEKLAPATHWCRENLDFLTTLAEGFHPGLDTMGADRVQCIHGDIHPGNVLFLPGGQPPLIIDFEDTCHSYLPLLVDLSVMVLRFCLVHSPSKATLRGLIRSLESAYAPDATVRLADHWQDIIWIIRQWCSHCILLQLGFALDQSGCDPEELLKFQTCYRLAGAYETLTH